jgi:hypothetical protein
LFREELEIEEEEEDIGCLRAVKVSGSHIRDRSSDERETSKRNGWMDGYAFLLLSLAAYRRRREGN